MKQIYDNIIHNLRIFFQDTGFDKAIIGLSGGIDSALVVVLATEALGKDKVLAVLMPSMYSSEHSISDSLELTRNLGIKHEIIPIKNIYDEILNSLNTLFEGTKQDVTEENIQARIRGLLLMAISNKQRRLLLNASNKSELSVGYGTLYGDLCGSLSVIGNIYKTEVYAMAKWINRDKEIIPEHIITKAPSAELRPGQKDSDSLPDYSMLDPILKEIVDKNRTITEIIADGYDEEIVRRAYNLYTGSRFKAKQLPPVLSINNAKEQ